ncbi:protein-export chaperone SecB [Limibaculum sp. M0105]|uniref:Protein-export protein SecB n=1 Tax=Thermohalobaculum xanthum TaxID=2753746 RepID=A0A8J7M8G6_9RHOB|nr:protein-export chaperone SecB [Thermohalobaculum xanthum]MBK0400519.1 protein-export chaperone SecB [Thermohalobaculum xanthum]
MAEDEPKEGAGAEAQPQQQQQQPQVKILAHFVRDLSFENVGAIEGTSAEGTPEISVNVNLEGNSIGEDRYQTAMKITATAKAGEKTRFMVELDYVGIFSINNARQDLVHPLVFIECPRLILPFARRVVADVTRDGGYPPLMIENVDFAALYRQRLAQHQAQQAGNA